MNKNISISKLFITVLFLMVYCNVFITRLHCGFSRFLEVAEQHDQYDNHITPLAENNHNKSHKHDDSKDDNCCNDKTSTFFASQINYINTSFEFKNIFFTNFTSLSKNIFVRKFHFISSLGNFSYELPPPKIPDIRIFISSFQI